MSAPIWVKELISLVIGDTNSPVPLLAHCEKEDYFLSYHELKPFLFPLSQKGFITLNDRFLDAAKEFYYASLAKYIELAEETVTILNKAKDEKLLLIPIKGLAYADEYYARFGFRPVCDVDLLIKPEDLQKGIALLEENGYKKHLCDKSQDYWEKEQCHLAFIKHTEVLPILVELHWAVDFQREGKPALPNLWDRLSTKKIGGEEFFVLSPEDNLLSLALHQRRFGKMMNLKYICDLGMILRKEKLDWEYIIRTAFKEKIRSSLYFLLYQGQLFLNNDLTPHIKRLAINPIKAKLIKKLTTKYSYCPPAESSLPYVYALCHLLFYDNILYPIKYILNIPQEQFATFFGLPIYAKKTKLLYRFRFFFMPYKLAKDILGNIVSAFSKRKPAL